MKTRLMWAYGSNLCHEVMRRRCPRAEPYQRLILPHGQLMFRLVADVESSDDEDHVVPGGLWKITAECEATLDQLEGVRFGLYTKRWLKLRINGEVRHALFYKMMNEQGIMPPSQLYVDTIYRGYRDFGLDSSILEDALARAHFEKEKTPTLESRWISKGRLRAARKISLVQMGSKKKIKR